MTDPDYLRSVGQSAAVESLARHPRGDRGIARLAAMLRGDPPPVEPAGPVADAVAALVVPRPSPPAPPRSPRPSPLRTAESCIHRDPGAGCCAGTTCELTRRRVDIRACLACVHDRDDT